MKIMFQENHYWTDDRKKRKKLDEVDVKLLSENFEAIVENIDIIVQNIDNEMLKLQEEC